MMNPNVFICSKSSQSIVRFLQNVLISQGVNTKTLILKC